VRIGVDAIMGCNRDIFLLGALVQHLCVIGRTPLNLINKPMETTLWKQYWLSSTDLGLDGDFVRYWELFVLELQRV
jgi:hypothetical protein